MDTPVARRAGPKEWGGLAVLGLPTLLLGLDVTVLYLALPHLAADLQPSSSQVLWIMDAYGFLIAGFLIAMGTLGDRIGRRKLLMIGAAAFGIVSVVAAYAVSAEMLIAARATLGIAGATLMPSTLSLISNMFVDARQRALAIGIWATMFALGMAVGPLVGGVLLEHFWWGSVFLVAVPLVGVLLLMAPVLLPEYRAPVAGRFDVFSVVLSLAAILSVIYAVKQLAIAGVEPGTVIVGVAGLSIAVAFVLRQRGLTDPLLDVRLFANRAFSAALMVMLIGLVGVGGVMFLVTQHLQLVEGLSPLSAGAWMGPPALMMLVAAIAAPIVARRVRPGFVVGGTLSVSTVGYLLLARVDSSNGVALVVSGFALVYLGLGAIAALGTDLVVSTAPPSKAGSAAAMSETVQELGIAVGVATLGSLAAATYRGRIGGHLTAELPADVAAAAGDSLSGAVSVVDRLPDEVIQQAKAAFTTGLNVTTTVAGFGIVILAVLAAVALRGIGPLGSNGYGAGEIDADAADVDLIDSVPGAGTPDQGELRSPEPPFSRGDRVR